MRGWAMAAISAITSPRSRATCPRWALLSPGAAFEQRNMGLVALVVRRSVVLNECMLPHLPHLGLDARNESAKAAGTGGLLQVASYMTGLSGGSLSCFLWVLCSIFMQGDPG